MLAALLLRCAGCKHPQAEHHPTMEWCTHRLDESQCVCEQYVMPEV